MFFITNPNQDDGVREEGEGQGRGHLTPPLKVHQTQCLLHHTISDIAKYVCMYTHTIPVVQLLRVASQCSPTLLTPEVPQTQPTDSSSCRGEGRGQPPQTLGSMAGPPINITYK